MVINSELPIVVIINSALPIVATKAITEKLLTEANSKLNESDESGSYITFRNISLGSFISDTQDDNHSPFIPLQTALKNVFKVNKHAIFIFYGYMVSIIYNPSSGFYVFDSHTTLIRQLE